MDEGRRVRHAMDCVMVAAVNLRCGDAFESLENAGKRWSSSSHDA